MPTQSNKPKLFLGVDTGGTFTDFVFLDGDKLRIHKVLSTPAAPEQAILQGIRELGLNEDSLKQLSVVHGSTVATNAALEGKGVRTAFITNRGFTDLLTIGRQARRELYNLQPNPITPPVPAELCLEVDGRNGPQGESITPLSEDSLQKLREQLERLQPRAVAINLLFSFMNDADEKVIEAIIPEDIFCSRSSAILPEYREYERGITTWLNSWVGPLVEGYLQRLQQGADGARIAVMQSSGDTINAAEAGAQAVHMLLSGPAGGLAGARHIAAQAGVQKLLTFDMGGTSTDVALIDGDIQLSSEGHIGPYPVAVPMVDMHTIGAGGGSIAHVDAGGMLQVGPESAGAQPGPACYGQGGERPTVTDANLILGRLRAEDFLGGGMGLDVEAARNAMGPLAEAMGLSIEQTAEGIIRVANEHMAQALRVMSVKRGIDPRKLTLACFGGAGGLHVCELAEALGMQQALVPIHAGVLSALGMLVAPHGRQLSRTLRGDLSTADIQTIESVFTSLQDEGRQALNKEGVHNDKIRTENSLELRYKGQSYTLNIPWHGNIEQAEQSFHTRHEDLYGHALLLPVELVTLRSSLRGPDGPITRCMTLDSRENAQTANTVTSPDDNKAAAIYQREELTTGTQIPGPALITEKVSTTWLAEGWNCNVVESGSLLLSKV